MGNKMSEPLYVQPLSYWLDQIDNMGMESLTKLKSEVGKEVVRRKLRTLTIKELGKIHVAIKRKISNLAMDDDEVDIGDCGDIVE